MNIYYEFKLFELNFKVDALKFNSIHLTGNFFLTSDSSTRLLRMLINFI